MENEIKDSLKSWEMKYEDLPKSWELRRVWTRFASGTNSLTARLLSKLRVLVGAGR